jgi:stage IV sporulation protein FB
VARLERIPEEPRQEFLIAIAGPAVNVVIGFALVLLAGAHLDVSDLSVDSAKISMIDRLANVNLFLAVFNMIPAFPMDGGRVLRALLAIRMGHTHATEVAAQVGQGVAFLLGFIGLLSGNPILIFIAIFVYLAAASEGHLVAMRAMSHGVPVTNAMMTQFARLTPQAHVDEAVQTLLRTSQSEFPVVDAADKPVGLLGRGDLIRALKQVGPEAKVAYVMTTMVPTVGHRSCLEDALRLLQEKSAPAVAVVDREGRLVGLVTSETIGEMMMLREALPPGATWGPWSRPTGA